MERNRRERSADAWRRRAAAAAVVAAALVAGGCSRPGAAPATPEELAMGEKVLDRFCLSCHSLADPRWNPLRQKLRPRDWGTEEAAYASIGRLGQISPGMTLELRGSDAERRALAKVLARLADGAR